MTFNFISIFRNLILIRKNCLRNVFFFFFLFLSRRSFGVGLYQPVLAIRLPWSFAGITIDLGTACRCRSQQILTSCAHQEDLVLQWWSLSADLNDAMTCGECVTSCSPFVIFHFFEVSEAIQCSLIIVTNTDYPFQQLQKASIFLLFFFLHAIVLPCKLIGQKTTNKVQFNWKTNLI